MSAPPATKNPTFRTCQEPRKDVIESLEKEIPRYAGTDKRVLLSFSCDPYQPLDETERLTRWVLQLLREKNIPFQVLTKGGLRACRDFDLYGANDAFATTLTWLNHPFSAQWEPGAAPPLERIDAIKKACESRLETWVSLEPVIDPAVSLEIIRRTHTIVSHYKIGKMNHWNTERTPQEWRKFGAEAVELCEKHDCSYYVKKDLAQFMQAIEFTNTDTRTISRSADRVEKKS